MNQKKRKRIDYSQIDLNDYLNIDLDDYKNYLYNRKLEYNNLLKKVEEDIKEANKLIGMKCEKINGSHNWVTERESGPYGEKFTFCKKCYINYHSRDSIYY